MKVLYKWADCSRFNNHPEAYYLEIHKTEITDKVLSLLKKTNEGLPDDQYFIDVKNFANSRLTSGLAHEDCIYALVDKGVTSAILCPVYYPYSDQWGSGCPFLYLYQTEMEIDKYLENVIEITDIEDIQRIDEIITSKGRVTPLAGTA